MTAAIVLGPGERNTRWARIAQIRSMGQKSSILVETKRMDVAKSMKSGRMIGKIFDESKKLC